MAPVSYKGGWEHALQLLTSQLQIKGRVPLLTRRKEERILERHPKESVTASIGKGAWEGPQN